MSVKTKWDAIQECNKNQLINMTSVELQNRKKEALATLKKPWIRPFPLYLHSEVQIIDKILTDRSIPIK